MSENSKNEVIQEEKLKNDKLENISGGEDGGIFDPGPKGFLPWILYRTNEKGDPLCPKCGKEMYQFAFDDIDVEGVLYSQYKCKCEDRIYAWRAWDKRWFRQI